MQRSPRTRCEAAARLIASASALLLALSGCSARPGLQVAVNDTPASHAWWLRSTFQAKGSNVRGIPVAQLDPGWCNADAFSLEAFPRELRRNHDGLDAMLSANAGAFSLRGNFAQRSLDIVLGVYRSCAGGEGDFLLVLDAAKPAGDQQRIVQLEVLSAEPAFLYLMRASRPDAIRIVSCFECDHVGEWRWDSTRARFVAQPEPEFE